MANLNTDLDINVENFITTIMHLVMVLFAGKTSITIASLTTRKRFGLRIAAPRVQTKAGGWRTSTEGPWHVKVRDAHGWSYVGTATQKDGKVSFDTRFVHPYYAGYNRTSSYSEDSDVVRAVRYLFWLATNGTQIPPQMRIWSSSFCCRCGAELSSEFRHLFIGPKCSGLSASVIQKARTMEERLELLHTAAAMGRGSITTETMEHILRLMPAAAVENYRRIKSVMDTEGEWDQIEALRAMLAEYTPSEPALDLLARNLPKGIVRDYAKDHAKAIYGKANKTSLVCHKAA